MEKITTENIVAYRGCAVAKSSTEIGPSLGAIKTSPSK